LSKALALLSFQVNTHVIKSIGEFDKRLKGVIGGVDLNKVAKVDPVLARNLADTIAGLKRQAQENIKNASGKGTGNEPTFVNIAAAIKSGAKAISDARTQAADDIKTANRAVKDASKAVSGAEHDVAKAQHALAVATDKLRTEQARELKLNSKFVRLNTAAIQQNNKLLGRGGGGSQKPKPKGDASSRAADLANHGAVTP
jgi:hypothetical protein